MPASLGTLDVKEEFSHLYRYGLGLTARNLLTSDEYKEIVQKRLVSRTGLGSPEELAVDWAPSL